MGKVWAIGCVLLLCCLIQTCFCASPKGIARTARRFKNSKEWLWKNEIPGLADEETDKCHLFVGYALRKAGAPAPNRDPPFFSPIGMTAWKDTSHIKRCWRLCDSPPTLGDVLVLYDHVAIVTGDQLTTRSSFSDLPLGIVVENDWGFREGQMPICWRYKYQQFTCFSFLGRWLYVQVDNCSVMWGRSHRFLGITSTFGEIENCGRMADEFVYVNYDWSSKAYIVLGQFLVFKRDEEIFKEWLKEETGTNKKQQNDCYGCLKDWCDQFL